MQGFRQDDPVTEYTDACHATDPEGEAARAAKVHRFPLNTTERRGYVWGSLSFFYKCRAKSGAYPGHMTQAPHGSKPSSTVFMPSPRRVDALPRLPHRTTTSPLIEPTAFFGHALSRSMGRRG